MADITDYVNIDGLPPADNIFGAEMMEVLQAGVNRRATAEQVLQPLKDALADPDQGAGMVALPQGGKISDAVKYFTPFMFGAVGGGIDDYAAIQESIDKASLVNGTVNLCGVMFYSSQRISLKSNVRIVGFGGGLATHPDFDTSFSTLIYGSPGVNSVTIDDVTIDAKENVYRGGIWLNQTSGVKIRNCRFIGDFTKEIAPGGLRSAIEAQATTDTEISDNLFDGFHRPIFARGTGYRISILRNQLRNMRSYGINFLDPNQFHTGIRIIGNYINGVGSRHNLIFIGAAQNHMLSGHHNDVVVANNYGEGADRAWPVPDPVTGEDGNGDLFSLRAMNNARVYGNYVINSGDLGLVIEFSKNVTVSDNVVARADISGLVIHNSYNVTVVNNVCYDNALDRSKRFDITRKLGGIKIMAGAKDVIVVGNRCYDTRVNSADQTQLYGLVITTQKQNSETEPDTGRVVVGSNMFYNNKVGGIYSDVTSLRPSLEFELADSAFLPGSMYPSQTVVRHTNVMSGAPMLSVATRSGYYTTTAAANAGATELVLDDVSFLNENTRLVIQFYNGGTLFNQVASVNVANKTVTLTTPLAQNVLSGAVVFFTVWRTAVNYV